MKFFIQLPDGAFVWKINRGNYYSASKKDKEHCILSKEKAKRYCERLSSMGVAHRLIVEIA